MPEKEPDDTTTIIRGMKTLLSGSLEAGGRRHDDHEEEQEETTTEALVDEQGLSNGRGDGSAAEEGVEHPLVDGVVGSEEIEGANGGAAAGVNSSSSTTAGCPASAKAKKLIHKSSSILADAAHISMPLYRHPRQRQRWQDTQVHPVKDWGDIFFDLFYVAAAYNLGHQLKADPTVRGLLYLVGSFLPIIGLWLQKLVYDARFYVGDDLSHRFYEVAVFLAIACSILNIRPANELSHPAESPEMFVFSLSLTVGYFLAMGRFAEVLVCQRIGCKGLYPEAYHAAVHQFVTFVPSLLLYVAATTYSGIQYYAHGSLNSDYSNDPSSGYGYLNESTVSHGDNATSASATNATDSSGGGHRLLSGESSVTYTTPTDDTTIWILLAGAISSSLTMIILVCYWLNPSRWPGFDPKTVTVPMNVDYTIHRYGEWVMLLLGESVLSLLIVQFVPSTGYQQVFYCGVVSIALLQYLHFRSQPHHADDHAMRRSRNAGILFVNVIQVYSIALVVLGTSFKMLLHEQVDEAGVVVPVPTTNETNSTRRATSTVLSRLLADATGSHTTATTSSAEMDKKVHDTNVAMFYCISLAVVWFCLDVMLLLHRGIKKHHDDINKCSRLHCVTIAILILCRIALVGFMASFWLTETRPAVLSFVGLWCIVLQLISREAGECLFKGDDTDEEEREAAENVHASH